MASRREYQLMTRSEMSRFHYKGAPSGKPGEIPVKEIPADPTKKPTDGAAAPVDVFAARKVKNKSAFDLSALKVKTQLTKQLFSIAHSKSLVIECTSEMYDKKLPNAGRGKADETDTILIDVISLETGEEGALICNALIVGAFKQAEGPLVGRIFAIREGGIREGKKYRSIDMVELSK